MVQIRVDRLTIGGDLAPVVIEPIEPVAVAHTLGYRETESRVGERDSAAARRNLDCALNGDRRAVGGYRLDVCERRQRVRVRASGVGHGDPAAEREPDAAMRVGDQRPVALHRVDRGEAVGHAVLADLGTARLTAEQRLPIDAQHAIEHAQPQRS